VHRPVEGTTAGVDIAHLHVKMNNVRLRGKRPRKDRRTILGAHGIVDELTHEAP